MKTTLIIVTLLAALVLIGCQAQTPQAPAGDTQPVAEPGVPTTGDASADLDDELGSLDEDLEDGELDDIDSELETTI